MGLGFKVVNQMETWKKEEESSTWVSLQSAEEKGKPKRSTEERKKEETHLRKGCQAKSKVLEGPGSQVILYCGEALSYNAQGG